MRIHNSFQNEHLIWTDAESLSKSIMKQILIVIQVLRRNLIADQLRRDDDVVIYYKWYIFIFHLSFLFCLVFIYQCNSLAGIDGLR